MHYIGKFPVRTKNKSILVTSGKVGKTLRGDRMQLYEQFHHRMYGWNARNEKLKGSYYGGSKKNFIKFLNACGEKNWL